MSEPAKVRRPLFPLGEAFPLGQIDVTLFRDKGSEVFRAYGTLDVVCYVPDTLFPGREIKRPLTLGHGRWRTEGANPVPGRSLSQVKNPLRGGVKAIGLEYRMRFSTEDLRQSDYDGAAERFMDCPHDYHREPIIALPVEVKLPG